MIRLIILLATLFWVPAFADGNPKDEIGAAKVYYYDWMATSMVALRPSLLKEDAFHTLVLEDTPLKQHLLELLESKDFSGEILDPRYMDGRLLIEFGTGTEDQMTFFATRTTLCYFETNVCAQIDAEFRSEMHRLITTAAE